MSSAAAVSLLGTAREVLTNAAKHAPGAPVTLVLDYRRTLVRVTIRNAAPTRPDGISGYGLTGMRERLALVGGSLVASAPDEGAGWQVVAEVPDLDDRPGDHDS